MEISAKRGFERSRKAIFKRFSTPERMNALIRDAGGRVDTMTIAEGAPDNTAGVGTAWRGAVEWRGMSRDFTLTLAEMQPEKLLRYHVSAPQFEVTLDFEFVDRPDGGTLVNALARPTPRGAVGRMAMQVVRLMPGEVRKRLKHAMGFLSRRK